MSCSGFLFLGNFQGANCCFCCGSHRERIVSTPVKIRLRNVPSLSALSIRLPHVLMWTLCWSCDRMRGTLCWVKWDMFSHQTSVASTMAIPCCCDFMAHGFTYQLQCITAPLFCQSTKLLTILRVLLRLSPRANYTYWATAACWRS
jgi:hypothetical protein